MTRSDVVLGPVALPEGVLVLRTPRRRDAAAWSRARLTNREWLERAFPAWGDDWAAEQSATAWIARCRHLRRSQRRGEAAPFVMLLDGRLIGELGIDAVDLTTHTGEGSVWTVRDRGAPAAFTTGSLLLIDHVFGDALRLDRLISPASTASREGRAPGLRASGFEIEATLPRPVGDREVDHDIWVLHNTPERRAAIRRALTAFPSVRATTELTGAGLRTPVPVLAAAFARLSLRSARARLRRRADAPLPVRRSASAPVTLDDVGTVRRDGRVVGRLDTVDDVGTATVTVRPAPIGPVAVDDLAAAVVVAAEDIARRSSSARWIDVGLTPELEGVGPALAVEGFVHAATFAPNPDGPHGYPGEQIWRRPV